MSSTNLYLPYFCALFGLVGCNESVLPNIIERSIWGAKDGLQTEYLETPSTVIIYHSGTPSCYTVTDCFNSVKSFQNYDMRALNWGDIRDNFLIGEDGYIYEGRGWKYASANSFGFHSRSIEICIIGEFVESAPNAAAINATKSLLAHGVGLGKLNPSYKLYLQRVTNNGSLPPEKLYDSMKNWRHWEDSPNLVVNSVWDANTHSSMRQIFTKIPSNVLVEFVNTTNCTTMETCTELFRNLTYREFSSLKPWLSVQSNFFVCEDGNIYEGAGWSNDNFFNGTSIKIIVAADFTNKTREQIYTVTSVMKNYLDLGVGMATLSPNFKVYEIGPTNSKLPQHPQELLETWIHWEGKPSIIERWEWDGQPIPLEEMNIQYFSSHVILYQFVTRNCIKQEMCYEKICKCKSVIKDIQDDNLYNFLIDDNGNIYEGTGWCDKITQRSEQRWKSLKICLIGSFENFKQANIIITALNKLLNYAVAITMLDPNYNIHGIRHSEITSASVDYHEKMKNFERWRESPNFILRRAWKARTPNEQTTLEQIVPSLNTSYSNESVNAPGNSSSKFKFHNKPITEIVIYHYNMPNCMTLKDCIVNVKEIQKFHMNTYNLSDIGCHFVIGADGYVYVGLGFNFKDSYALFDHTSMIRICTMGQVEGKNFDSAMLSKMLNTIRNLLKYGEAIGEINSSYVLHGTEYQSKTSNLAKEIKKMPNCIEFPIILGRKSWNATAPARTIETFHTIPSVVFISYIKKGACLSISSCIAFIKELQNFDMNKQNRTDIAQNFLIDEAGRIYIGRDWNAQGPYRDMYRRRSIEIAVIGEYPNAQSANVVTQNLKTLLGIGVKMFKLHPMYILYDSRDTNRTFASTSVRDIVKKWPRYREFSNLIPRASWNASLPKELRILFHEIPSRVVVTTLDTVPCQTKEQCSTIVKTMQRQQMKEDNSNDIKYNFVVGNDGNIYKGLGWHFEEPTWSVNDESYLAICVIGTANDPSSQTLRALENLLAYGIARGKLHPWYVLSTKRKVGESSGSNKLFDLVEKWPHWQPTVSLDDEDATN